MFGFQSVTLFYRFSVATKNLVGWRINWRMSFAASAEWSKAEMVFLVPAAKVYYLFRSCARAHLHSQQRSGMKQIKRNVCGTWNLYKCTTFLLFTSLSILQSYLWADNHVLGVQHQFWNNEEHCWVASLNALEDVLESSEKRQLNWFITWQSDPLSACYFPRGLMTQGLRLRLCRFHSWIESIHLSKSQDRLSSDSYIYQSWSQVAFT